MWKLITEKNLQGLYKKLPFYIRFKGKKKIKLIVYDWYLEMFEVGILMFGAEWTKNLNEKDMEI